MIKFKITYSYNDQCMYFPDGTIVKPKNHSYLNHPYIQERINYIRNYGIGKPIGPSNSASIIGNSINKYFMQAPLVQYASGICIKKYRE